MIKQLILKQHLVLWVIATGSVIVPFFLPNRYFQDIAVMTFLWAGLATSWNLYSGYCKRLSIGHAAYLGIGAYTSTLLYLNFGISPWIGMLAGGVISAIAALIIGGTTLRLKGTFFVLSTIAFAEILKVMTITSKDITAGALGLMIPYQPGFANMIWQGKIPYAVLTWIYMIVVLIISVRLEKSKLGYSLIALGENQEAAENLGVNSTRTMLVAFVMSAVLTSFGGTLFAQYVMFIEPTSVMSMGNSINFILLAIAGGMGTAFGPMVGSFILTPVSNLLRGYLAGISGLHGLILGLVLIVILLYRPDGILPQLKLLFRYLFGKFVKPGKGE
ncbi:branched-chain amino acid ABC transporter permease [Anoxybacterium hadale]|uniref:Branched-chain amino acid ABC transporter permease n=1 Tax=Anoxybacterium hadale TaxID=3408580 RepID=A0ACD1A8H7_9FIRM|nr:branched-chain amino acid ABC transporter permease [Clostridiales bacterium]